MAQAGDLIFCVRGSTTGRRVVADDSYCFFFFYCSGHPQDLHSFPTRRSSDLPYASPRSDPVEPSTGTRIVSTDRRTSGSSEEHTSHLPSRREIEYRLLLEK